jgi:hypothetical protein
LRSHFSSEERAKYWLNTLEHCKGNHGDCPSEHPLILRPPPMENNLVEHEELDHFLRKTVKSLSQCRNRFSTQLCQSFNSIKVQFVSKSIAWQFSWEMRTMCAIMKRNMPDVWKMDLYWTIWCPATRFHKEVIERMGKEHDDRMTKQAIRASKRAIQTQDGTRNRLKRNKAHPPLSSASPSAYQEWGRTEYNGPTNQSGTCCGQIWRQVRGTNFNPGSSPSSVHNH